MAITAAVPSSAVGALQELSYGYVAPKPTSCRIKARQGHLVVKAQGLIARPYCLATIRSGLGREESKEDATLSITVVGASGNLARKKLFPALFALYYEGSLPEHFTIFGYARSEMTDEQMRSMIRPTLTCRIDKREDCEEKISNFLKRCFYQRGGYDSEEHFGGLDRKLKEHEGGRVANRMFYLSVPPDIFLDVARCTSRSAASSTGWTRVVIEKPFGRDSETSANLTAGLQQHFMEQQIYRIDHYLGKAIVKNLSALRNSYIEEMWSNKCISNVQMILSEDFGTEGRGGYFDNYGIIRDVMQNHMLQMLAIFAMEPPVSSDAEEIRNEKVKLLRSVRKLQLDNLVIGQYTSEMKGGRLYPGYTQDKTVPTGSTTPTFAALVMFIDNTRWEGVPFIMKAGKALKDRRAEIRVQFRHQGLDELLIRVQPDGGIYLKVDDGLPILRLDYLMDSSRPAPDAYESLILDAMQGERKLFIRSDELEAAWEIFTPLLKELEEKRVVPRLYPYGSRGPAAADELAAKHNTRWGDVS